MSPQISDIPNDNYETLIELQNDIKNFETAVDNHKAKVLLLKEELKKKHLDGNGLGDNFLIQEKILKLKTENQDLIDIINGLHRKVMDFYTTHNVPGMKKDSEKTFRKIQNEKEKLELRKSEFDEFLAKYEALDKNLLIDENKYKMYHLVFIGWILLLIVFLYICFKMYITNNIPSITFYIFFIASIFSFYYIYTNLKKYFNI